MKLKVKKLHPEAILPTYATPGAACFDLHVCPVNWHASAREFGLQVMRGKHVVIETGLAFEVPEGYVMLIYSRSGHGFKTGVRLSNCVGVIDSDYRGQVMVAVHADRFGFGFRAGDRVAQAMVVPVNQVEFDEVTELSATVRGDGGLGSTGR